MRAWLLLPLLVASCTKEGGPTATLVLQFETEETFAVTERIEVTVYDMGDRGDHCEEVMGNPDPDSFLATKPIVAGPAAAPMSQVSSLGLEAVTWGKRLFYVTAHNGDDDVMARGCTDAEILPSGVSVTVVMQRVPCDGEGSFPCGPDAVCRNGECEDRACRMEGEPVALRDLTTSLGVGAQQVVPTDEGILVAWSGIVGVRRGVAVAHLSDDLRPLGETRIIDGDPSTWPALAPTSQGFILAWTDYGPEGDQRGIVRAVALDKGGAQTGTGDQVTLAFPGRYASADSADWNAPGMFRLLPTSTGAVAAWYEWAAADATPDTGPWRVSVAAIGEDGVFSEDPHALDYPSAFVFETSPGRGDGVAIEFIVAETGECRLATVAPDGRVISDEALTGSLASCATVAFGPTTEGYTFLGQESRRLTPWPSGDPGEPLIQPPDVPLAAATWGAFAQAGDRRFVGWEEHSADALTSRINVAVLDERGIPTAAGVPFDLAGNGPYFGFSMTATTDAVYAAWLEAPDAGNLVAVARIVCD